MTENVTVKYHEAVNMPWVKVGDVCNIQAPGLFKSEDLFYVDAYGKDSPCRMAAAEVMALRDGLTSLLEHYENTKPKMVKKVWTEDDLYETMLYRTDFGTRYITRENEEWVGRDASDDTLIAGTTLHLLNILNSQHKPRQVFINGAWVYTNDITEEAA